MSNIPIISVIIPVYNVEKYVNTCLRSIHNQTFRNFELICINDGSTDKSLQILNYWKELDSRITIIDQENFGPSKARNEGIKIAQGKYIIFIDADDYVNESYLENLYNSITGNDCDLAVSNMIRKRKNKEKYRLQFKDNSVYTDLQEKIDICRVPTCCYACGKLFKTSLIKNYLFKENTYFEDVFWLPEALKKAKTLVTVPQAIYFYVVNNNSIVKKTASPQKQRDLYIARKLYITFANNNNLKISNKTRQLAKKTFFFMGIPILKIRELNNIETFLLFGFIPIWKRKVKENIRFKKIKRFFLCKILDSHLYINLFSIHIGIKLIQKFKVNQIVKKGITDIKRPKQLIISLTSYPDRINEIHKTISTLLNQDLLPDRVILWLADSQFPNKYKDLPNNLIKLKDYGLEIMWCKDLKSYKKLVPALQMFPEDIIVTADDDLFYQQDWLRSLYECYEKNPKNIYSRRATHVSNDGYNNIGIKPNYDNANYKACYCNQLMGGAGTLYPPHSLHQDVYNIEQINTLIPTHDDIYFWAMALLNGTKIGLVKNKNLDIIVNPNAQTTALCKKNNSNSTGMSGDEAFLKIFRRYPEIIEQLYKES